MRTSSACDVAKDEANRKQIQIMIVLDTIGIRSRNRLERMVGDLMIDEPQEYNLPGLLRARVAAMPFSRCDRFRGTTNGELS